MGNLYAEDKPKDCQYAIGGTHRKRVAYLPRSDAIT